MNTCIYIKNNEKGSVLIVTLIMLCLLSLIGIAASRTSESEISVANNQRFYKVAFYSAETARSYVATTPTLYNSDHIDVDQAVTFPDETDSTQTYSITSTQTFNGDVRYTGSATVPRGSGFEAGKFRAHKYKMDCTGYGPSNGQATVISGFYRIGF